METSGTWRLLPQEPEATRDHRAAHEGVSAADHQSGPQLPCEIRGTWEKMRWFWCPALLVDSYMTLYIYIYIYIHELRYKLFMYW